MGEPVKIRVYVQPKARVSEVAGFFRESLKIKIAAPPEDSAANEALIQFCAEILGISTRQIQILQGLRSRHKVISIRGLSLEEILAKLRV